MSFTTEFPGRIGNQRPRLSHLLPQVSNQAHKVAALGMILGMRLDNFQKWYLKHITGIREDGKWAAFECDIEIPRQNGKTGGIEVLMLYHLLFVKTSRKIVYSAHEFKTTLEIFTRIDDMLASVPDLYSLVKVKRGKDDMSIQMLDGSSHIKFMARSRKAGRGMAGDLLVLDEAFAVTSEMIAAIMPTMSSRSMTGNPQIIFMSSAGMHDSHYLNGMRERALGDDPGRIFFAEWSAPDDVDSEDREHWYSCNPALGVRISEEYIYDELRAFRADPERGEEQWRRERLGIRPKLGGSSLFDMKKWLEREDPTAEPSDLMVFSVDVTPSRESASITMTSLLENGDVYMELIDRREGTSWVPERMRALQRSHNPLAIICDDYGASGTLIEPMRKAGVRKIETVNIKDYIKACGDFFDMVHRSDSDSGPVVVHRNQKELHDAIAVAKKSMKGDTAWVLSRKDVTVDISPLVAGVQSLTALQKRGKIKQRNQREGSPTMMVFG